MAPSFAKLPVPMAISSTHSPLNVTDATKTVPPAHPSLLNAPPVESSPESTTFWTQSLNYVYKFVPMDTLKTSPITNATHAVMVVSYVRQARPIARNVLRKIQKSITSSQD